MYRRFALVALLALIPGCNAWTDFLTALGVDVPPVDGPVATAAQLKAFESEDELTDYFNDQVNARNTRSSGSDDFDFLADEGTVALDADAPTGGAGDGAAPTAPEGNGADTSQSTEDSFSETTTQEEGVDEADVVKTDGTYVYVISDDKLRIVQAAPMEQLAQIAELDLEGNGREMYLYGDTVVALTEVYRGYPYGGGVIFEDVAFVDTDTGGAADEGGTGQDVGDTGSSDGDFIMPEYDRPKTIVTIIDVSTPSAPRIISTTTFDGSIGSSRMVGGMLYLVLANYQNYYYDIMPMLTTTGARVEATDVETLLPNYEHVAADGTTTSGSALTWRELYHPIDPDGFGLVSVISLDVDNDASFEGVGVVAEPGMIYSSVDALYLTDTEWDFRGDQRETTDIYKLAYDDKGATPVAAGSVTGRILDQYSMGEYDGYLRVAASVGAVWGEFGQTSEAHNNVYVLEEVGGKLELAGSIQNIAPGETIRSARFMADRGYVVTFREIDPFFTLNMADPRNPTLVGELKVPGFSTFIVPMDNNHILTVGQYIPEDQWRWDWGVQLSIFDVTDFANPVLKHLEVIGEGTGAHSEALHNPKAFTYFPEGGMVALPLAIYGGDVFIDDGIALPDDGGDGDTVDTEPAPGDDPIADEPVDEPVDEPADPIEPDGGVAYEPEGFEGLAVFTVSTETGFGELGRISTRFPESGYYGFPFTRGVFIGDDVYAITQAGVRAAAVNSIDTAQHEVVFERAD